MKNISFILVSVVSVCLGLNFINCAAMQTAPTPVVAQYQPKFVPAFDFKTSQDAPSDISIALLQTQEAPPKSTSIPGMSMSGITATEFNIDAVTGAAPKPAIIPAMEIRDTEAGRSVVPNGTHRYAKLFIDSIQKDIDGLLIARGFKTSGPFESINEMTFPQKKQSDLILNVSLDWVFDSPKPQLQNKPARVGIFVVEGSGTSANTVLTWQGQCSMTGTIIYEIWEPLSAQKVWFKKVAIPAQGEDCSAEGSENFITTYDNAVAKLLERAYQEALKKAGDYFNREEIELVKKQSMELREKKVYN